MRLTLLLCLPFLALSCATIDPTETQKYSQPSHSQSAAHPSRDTELDAIDSELAGLESLIAGAEARLRHYEMMMDDPGKDGMISATESEITHYEMRKSMLESQKLVLQSQLRLEP